MSQVGKECKDVYSCTRVPRVPRVPIVPTFGDLSANKNDERTILWSNIKLGNLHEDTGDIMRIYSGIELGIAE